MTVLQHHNFHCHLKYRQSRLQKLLQLQKNLPLQTNVIRAKKSSKTLRNHNQTKKLQLFLNLQVSHLKIQLFLKKLEIRRNTMKHLWMRHQIKVMIKSLNGRIGRRDSTRSQTITIKISTINNGKAIITIMADSISKCIIIIILSIQLTRITRNRKT